MIGPIRVAAAASLLLATASVPLQAANPPAQSAANAVRARIAAYRELGAAFKNAMDSLRGEPQLIMIRQSAREIKSASQGQYNWFPAGTGPRPPLKTLAKPEIWTRAAEFRAAQDNFARQADAFQAAAASGNAAAIRSAARSLGGACKNCHDTFRTPPKD